MPPATRPPSPAAGVVETPGLSQRELSTLEAAKFLNVAHGVVVQEIDGGRLKSHQVGVDLRIRLADLVDYALETRLSA